MSVSLRKVIDRHTERVFKSFYHDREAVMYYRETGNKEKEDFHTLSCMITVENLKNYILSSLSEDNMEKDFKKKDFAKLEKKIKTYEIREEKRKDIDIKKLIIEKVLSDKKKLSETD